MSGRTFAIGDIHGETGHFSRLLAKLPALETGDTLVFLGDYVDRGPHSKEVVEQLMAMPARTPAKVVCLRGNHEDAWLRVRREGWDEFVFPPAHGCLPALRSFTGGPVPAPDEKPSNREMALLASGDFFPPAVATWMESLPFWYEDENGIYVHAGLPRGPDGFLHPAEVAHPAILAWTRGRDFVLHYRGKNVFVGHTPTDFLPQELSLYTPNDPTDMFESEDAFGLDTGCGQGGFLTAIELPAMQVYESRGG
jgi:serine/threonine protein phosphatase 1